MSVKAILKNKNKTPMYLNIEKYNIAKYSFYG